MTANARTGVIAKKMGMMRLFADDGAHVPVTVLSLDGCTVVGHRTEEKDGYSALRLGAGSPKVKRLTKAERGQFAKASVEPRAKIVEVRVGADMMGPVGAEIGADHFVPGQRVDVAGVTFG